MRTVNGQDIREYQTTHSHISFEVALSRPDPVLWALLGEARSKAEHVAWTLLHPETARELLQVYLTKGVLATTAIEGNTLSEEEVRRVVDGQSRLPRSREYLGTEAANVVAAFNAVKDGLLADPERDLTVEDVCQFNGMILEGLELEDGVVPGAIRVHSVGVGGVYRAAPARDCEYLLQRLCDWVNGDYFEPRAEADVMGGPLAIVKAIVVHLYLAWIHPFGDGNGRTARLLELWVLLKAGFPAPSTQLLSNHYNATREEYYRQLQRASAENDVVPFVTYAARGFVDGLREQLDTIWRHEAAARWEQLIYQTFGHISSAAQRRRLELVLAMPFGTPVPKAKLRHLTPELAEQYAGTTTKTLTRDLRTLVEMELIERHGSDYLTRDWVIHGFMPERNDGGVLDLDPAARGR